MAREAVEEIDSDLEIDEQLKLHQTGWIVQRIGWVIILLLPVLGALGLFGEGVLSGKKEIKGPVAAEYERFYRYQKEMEIKVASTEHMPQIALPQQYLQHFRVVRIIPEPEHRIADSGNIVYHFGGSDNRQVTIYAVPESYGSLSGEMAVNNQVFSIYHFIFP